MSLSLISNSHVQNKVLSYDSCFSNIQKDYLYQFHNKLDSNIAKRVAKSIRFSKQLTRTTFLLRKGEERLLMAFGWL